MPVTLLETNACSSLATNALAGDIWDNFSSSTYKSLPSVGSNHGPPPDHGRSLKYEMPAGGRGYIRPPSLISLWSSAPFLLNNSLGDFLLVGVGRRPDEIFRQRHRAAALAGETQGRSEVHDRVRQDSSPATST